MQLNKEEGNESRNQCTPEERAWLLSQVFFLWQQPVFQRANELGKEGKALEHGDLLPLPAWDKGGAVADAFQAAWLRNADAADPNGVRKLEDLKGDAEQGTKRLRKTLLAVMGRRFITAGIIKFFNSVLQFSFPVLLNAILRFIEDTQDGVIDSNDKWMIRYKGYWLSALLLVAMAIKAITENAYFHRVTRAGYQAKVAISVAVYNKSLRLTNAERQSTTLGELINLMQVDASKIEAFIPQSHVLWDGAFQICGYMAILYSLIGWPCFAGLFLMILAAPVQGIIMTKLHGLNRKMVKHTDARVEATNEALQGIQSVKMQTWEDEIMKRIAEKRDEELSHMKQAAYLRGFSRAYMFSLPGLVAVTSFVVYALWRTGADISAPTLFAALVAFDQLRFPLMFYPMALALLVHAKVSAARVEVFLGLKEVAHGKALGDGTYTRDEKSEGGISLKNAEVYWSDPDIPIEVDDRSDDESTTSKSSASKSTKGTESTAGAKNSSEGEDLETGSDGPVYPKPALKGVTMEVKTGQLSAVVGRVASGKSTLCSAVLNETFLKSGEVALKGKVAYASQTPWVLNASIRDNILFGLPMDEEKYRRVLKASQLEHDIEMLEDGDLTDIGERGINLSGGQKARVGIARAAYSDSDTIILDDPLSALDPEVAKNLFNECIVGLMKGKTRMLVTNQIQFLSSCDSVVALKKGEVIETGSYEDLINDPHSEVNRLLTKSSTGKSTKAVQREGEGEDNAESGDGSSSPIPNKPAKTLNTKEERNVGAVPLSVYLKYINAGGGKMTFAVVLFGYILAIGNGVASSSWGAYWTSDNEYEKHSEAFYLGIFFMLAVTVGFVTFIRGFQIAKFGVRASESMHHNLLKSVLRASEGRILQSGW